MLHVLGLGIVLCMCAADIVLHKCLHRRKRKAFSVRHQQEPLYKAAALSFAYEQSVKLSAQSHR